MQVSRAEEGGDVVAVLRGLLAAGDFDAVIALFTKLQSTHKRELEKALTASGKKTSTRNEGVSTEQLALLFARLKEGQDARPSTVEADTKMDEHVPPPAPGPDGKKHGPRRRPPRRRPLPDLPVVPNVIPVPDADRPCPVCGRERACVGHTVTRVIDIEPARAFVREDRREVLECGPCAGEKVTAPLGDKVIEGGVYGSTLVAQLVVDKFDDGLPLYRQHERLERLGLDMPEASMGDQVRWAAEALQPVASALLEQVLSSETMHLDGTSIPVLDRDDPKGVRSGALWGYAGVNLRVDGDVVHEEWSAAYLYMPTGHARSKSGEWRGPADMLDLRRERRRPHVVCDAASHFDASFARPGLVEVGCNMHGRRYFAKALEGKDERAARPIAAYKRLYEVEESIRGKPPDVKLAARMRHSRPIFDELVSWCETYKRVELNKSLLGRAVRYLTNHRVALSRFLDDGSLPIDNGVVERMHRRHAVGRRNFLFAGSDAGAERAAIAYSVLATCRLNGINPIEYVADVLPRLARRLSISRDLPGLLPAAWKRARSATQ